MNKENFRMAIRPRDRRGALLLVCLVLLVLFLLLGITFVLTANSFRKGTRSALRAKQFEQPLDTVNVLDSVLMEFLRGSSNPRSPFTSHNLLGDLYGEPVLKGRVILETDENNNLIDDNLYSGGGQFMRLEVDVDAGFKARNMPGYYAGQVLTMVTGPAAGQSRRIVKYDPDSYTFVVMAFRDRPAAGNRLVVNGREFSGTGHGYLPEAGGPFPEKPIGDETTTTPGTGWFRAHHALYPNSTFFEPTTGVDLSTGAGDPAYLTPAGLGGQNEDYDAADYNNPWLAIVTNRGIKPSFHDPALIQHWLGWASEESSGFEPERQINYHVNHRSFAQFYRRASFRPIRIDHPSFTGSNPDFASDTDPADLLNNLSDPRAAYEWWRDGPWDVDNDGDSIPDSIWIDIGLPVQSLEDGRVVKPLVAMLVRDMDGRVNINTAGTQALADATASVSDNRLAGPAGSANFPRGSGYGPAEIDLRWILTEFNSDGTLASFASDTAVEQLMQELLAGSSTAGATDSESYLGRYADSIGSGAGPGQAGANDLPGRLWMTNVWGSPDAFIANPQDLLGLGVVAVDHRGNPLRGFMGDATSFVDDPYEMYLGDLALSNTLDKPFSYEELERVLRALDVDNGTLERRLLALGGGLLVRNRDLITTDSWSLPVYSAGVPFNKERSKSMREILRIYHRDTDRSVPAYPQHITDVFLARVLQEGGSATGVQNLVNAGCIAPEMMAGLRFDVNRLFGNGIDDDGNGIVDEPAEAGLDDEVLYGSSIASAAAASMNKATGGRNAAFNDVPLDLNRDGILEDPDDADRAAKISRYQGQTDFAARQDYARQLYCLLMLVADRDGAIKAFKDSVTNAGGGAGGGADPSEQYALEIFARRMAQYAINVVDFRDPDAIMTPFSYDPRPFDGWTTDGQNVVWGCETPVAMLSESLALHNMRLVDKGIDTKEDAYKNTDDEWEIRPAAEDDPATADVDESMEEFNLASNKDQHPDQAGIPMASLFFEVYCPANANNDYFPPELFTGNELDLGRLAVDPDDNTIKTPVWRVVISEPHENEDESVVGILRNPELRDRLEISPQLVGVRPQNNDGILIEPEREVFFATDQSPSATRFANTKSGDDPNTRLRPGEYVVVGPRQYTVVSQSGTDGESRQLIWLDTDGAGPRAMATDGDGSDDFAPSSLAKPSKAIICQASEVTDFSGAGFNGLNVSAPLSDTTPYYKKMLPAKDDGMYQARPKQVDHEGDIDNDGDDEGMISDGYLYQYMVDGSWEDVPLDVPFYENTAIQDKYGMNANDYPVAQLNQDGKYQGKDTTVANYRTLFLQRLANPLLPFDATTNPYLTVDFLSVDLTIYARDENLDNKNNVSNAGTEDVALRSRERGVTYRYTTDANRDGNANDPAYSRNLWRQAMLNPVDNSNGTGNSGFNHDLVHSLGFLNRTFIAADNLTMPTEQYVDIASAGTVDWFSTAGEAGDPATPFPWLVWNDRPFVSQYELMQVPASAPGLLGFEFSDGYTAELNLENASIDRTKVNNHYAAFQSSAKLEGPSLGFNHLLNFFNTGTDGDGVDLGAVFDYLRVPSLYPSSHTILNPKDFTGPNGNNPWTGAQNDRFYDNKLGFGPPFNYVSNYREPGKINLNTIQDPRVWWALMHGLKVPTHELENVRHPALRGSGTDADRGAHLTVQRHPGPSWDDFVRHRRGYSSAPGYDTYDPLALQGRPTLFDEFPYYSPTYIGLPFRSQVNWDLNPMIGILGREGGQANTPEYSGPDATLLRRQVNNPNMTILKTEDSGIDPESAKYPLFRDTGPAASEQARPYADDGLNSYFKYQPINRLGNLTTTQSNVYSIWITVGYFEVSTAPLWTDSDPPTINDFVYPDGYQLGREVGEDTGEVTRHRAFYIVDRSIPVAYENGQDYNVENVIKLRRKIE